MIFNLMSYLCVNKIICVSVSVKKTWSSGSESLEAGDTGNQSGSKVIINVPTFIQNYSWDCGLACASMVLK